MKFIIGFLFLILAHAAVIWATIMIFVAPYKAYTLDSGKWAMFAILAYSTLNNELISSYLIGFYKGLGVLK